MTNDTADQTKARIGAVLEELAKLYPDWRFGQLVANVACWAREPTAEAVWDVEDAEFLRAAEDHLRRKLSAAT